MLNQQQDELLLHLSEFFKALSDYSRMKIIYVLLNKELCVNDIVSQVDMSQTAVSYQLKLLRQMHLVKYRRMGQNVLYSIDDEHVNNIIQISMAHMQHMGE